MDGAVFTAREDKIEYIKFRGTVRYSHCSGLEAHIEKLFGDKSFEKIIIDLNEAEILDSTALGLLARIAIRLKEFTEEKATIFIRCGELSNILERVCFDRVFNIVTDKSYEHKGELHHLIGESKDESQILQSVIEANKNLAAIDSQSDKFYRDITDALS
ncbi:MAG: STAS domain-containing protein [Gammaproteobacteria bacterium]|nr:STAS domain-containing protein [Gammaproteobacteria bacterium]MDH5629921.1 STAS domain-containing protein [Gammaproteobacteria bacterium]